ncbi:MAG: RraA family protein [Chitinophagaceae bacterium]|nr:RraA family protein [Chitinophagaceae bacterium]
MNYFEHLREKLYSAAISDALDSLGYRKQSPAVGFTAYSGISTLVGRCRTTLWADIYDVDPEPYKLELEAVDSCKSGDVLICAANGSTRSGIWGELLSTASLNGGCSGVVVHGAIRDIRKMTQMGFPVFACATSPYDSLNRQKVISVDVQVQIGEVMINPGDLVFADEDGIVFVPKDIEEKVIQRALKKVGDENITRDAIKRGMKAAAAYEKYGVL